MYFLLIIINAQKTWFQLLGYLVLGLNPSKSNLETLQLLSLHLIATYCDVPCNKFDSRAIAYLKDVDGSHIKTPYPNR